MGRVGRTLIVLVLLASSGDCALFLVPKHQPYDYFSFFSSSVLNPLHHMQNLCCRGLVHLICFSAGCGTYISGLSLCPCPFRGNFPFKMSLFTWSITWFHTALLMYHKVHGLGKKVPRSSKRSLFPILPHLHPKRWRHLYKIASHSLHKSVCDSKPS